MKNGDIVALDAKITLDDKALFRHPENSRLKDDYETGARELKAGKYGFTYHEFNGSIGCIVNGEGLAMAMAELLKRRGSEVACWLNVKGRASTGDKIAAGIKIIATNPRVEGIVINILGGFVRCDLIADGIIDAAAEVGMNIPLVVRFEGTNRDEAENVLKRARAAADAGPQHGRRGGRNLAIGAGRGNNVDIGRTQYQSAGSGDDRNPGFVSYQTVAGLRHRHCCRRHSR